MGKTSRLKMLGTTQDQRVNKAKRLGSRIRTLVKRLNKRKNTHIANTNRDGVTFHPTKGVNR